MASILIGDPSWITPAAAILVVAAAMLWWAYRQVTAAGRVRGGAMLLKITALGLLALCLVEPLWSGMRVRPQANLFALLFDTSQSLNIRDGEGSATRGERLREVFGEETLPWQVRLAQDFDVRRYSLDSRLQRLDSTEELKFDGNATSLKAALQTLRERFRDRPVAGVLLFTDGNATDIDGEDFDLEELPPIYPVVVGDEKLCDLAIRNVAVSRTSFEDAPVTIRADVAALGEQDGKIVAKLLDESANVVEEQRQSVRDGDESLTFRFQVRPTQPGLSFYKLRVTAEDELEQFDQQGSTSEATLANNARLIRVDRGQGPLRVLYVSGRPNWEFKFLRRAIEADEQIDLVGLLRIAKREPKFDWRGRAGESSNPLFRGFDAEGGEEAERYDEPVLVRLNTKDAGELQGGFPQKAEELFAYHAVIVDDLEAEFFKPDQLALLEKFVSERGGSLLMLGGQESFREGNYRRTPIAGMLPVYLDRVPPAQPDARYRLSLTREGWLQPWIRLRPSEDDERERLKEMPAFQALNRVGQIKAGAGVLALAVDDQGEEHPALVAHRFGRGRCAAMCLADLWRWHLKREEHENDDALKAWRQMLRWLVADVPERIDLELADESATADAVTIQARIRNPEFQPLDNADVQLAVTAPDGKTVQLHAEPSLEVPGLFAAEYVPRSSGIYRALATVLDDEGRAIGTAETGWAADPAEREFRAVVPNRALMQHLAERTGGQLVEGDELESFVTGLSSRPAPITEQWTSPLWHRSWMFLLVVGCLVGEWGLRRWKGLP